MKFAIIFALLTVAAARSPISTEIPQERFIETQRDVIQIFRDDRVPPGEDGTYSFDFETENGIIRSESGSKLNIEEEPVGQQGSYSFDLPNGERFELKFVANENGFQPESPYLPVAPEFPHPIPDFVLEQIEKAARENADASKGSSSIDISQQSYN